MLEEFERDGFVALRSAVPDDTVDRCRAEISARLGTLGVDTGDPSTWTRPVVRLDCPETPAFAAAGTRPMLWETYDALLGPGTWWKREGVGGTIAARFPSPDDPGDAGWHVDASFETPSGYHVNVASKARGLLCLFLFSDIGPNDAPTEIKVGSHLDLPPILEPFGDAGTDIFVVARAFSEATLARASAFATGRAGDVYVCHPFLVHRATWPHRGTAPRLLAQPGVALNDQFPLTGRDAFPVERSILRGLGR